MSVNIRQKFFESTAYKKVRAVLSFGFHYLHKKFLWGAFRKIDEKFFKFLLTFKAIYDILFFVPTGTEDMQLWRNWHTRMIQVHVSITLVRVQVPPTAFEFRLDQDRP